MFTLVLLPERLPIAETASAIAGLDRLGIPVQARVVNQVILPRVVQGNPFLEARANVQGTCLDQIRTRFARYRTAQLPLLDHDVADLAALREVGRLLYGN